MKSRTWTLGSVCSLFVVVLAAASTMYAAPIRVDCAKGGSINNTLASLTSAGNTRGIAIFVTGTCRENIAIAAFDHLTLQASGFWQLLSTLIGSARRSVGLAVQAACRESPVLPTLADQADCLQRFGGQRGTCPIPSPFACWSGGGPLSRDLPDHAATSCAIARAATIERYTVDIPAWIQSNTAVGY